MPSRQDMTNAIRALAMDAVQKANSGHPGMPMGMADIAEVLWRQFLKFNPNNPNWANRDRFILSNGHGAMLHYALLYLAGFDVSIEDLKQFRQLHSKTPGHPEYGDTPGVETTTGPLGQGIANGVGMAIAERNLAAHFNRDGHTIVDHRTYVFAGDGCLMEGVSHEACSLAGTLGLGKLIVFYDDNGISIDGEVDGWFTDNTPERFNAYGWQVIADVDGHNDKAITKAIKKAHAEPNKPTLICCKTHIGFGSPNKVDTAASHGSPLGEDEVAITRKALQWPHAPFVIPDEILSEWSAKAEGAEREAQWNMQFAAFETAHPDLAKSFLRRLQGWLPEEWSHASQQFVRTSLKETKAVATRKASQAALNAYAPMLPELIGGSADLTGSNCTNWSGSDPIRANNPGGNYIEYGVREFGMSAISNGLALHGGFIPYAGTFLVFTDYARNAVRLSALMQQKVIYVYTHDSIGLGEDGPTHQPIEHAAMLRMTPNMHVWRPCDVAETAVAWQQAIEYQGPSSLLLSRQNLPAQQHADTDADNIKRGGYVLYESHQDGVNLVDAILIATGSEVDLAAQAAKALAAEGMSIRVVSMPCADVFKQQDPAYQESVLPADVRARVAVEAGVSDYWHQFVGMTGRVIGIDHFGASAPAKDLFEAYGFTVDNIKQEVLGLVHRQQVSSY